MSDIMLNLVVLAVLLTVGVVVFIFFFQKQKQKEQKLVDLVKQKGWKLEKINKPLEKGFRFINPNWVLETVKRSGGVEAGPGSSEWQETTTWTSPQSGSVILLGPKTTQPGFNMPIDFLIKQLIHTALGEEARGVEEVFLGPQAFQEKFMVWASDPSEAHQLITPGLISALSSWKKPYPLIKRTSLGVSVELNGVFLNNPDEIVAFIQLGERLL